MGWWEVGRLDPQAHREELVARVSAVYPTRSEASVAAAAGNLHRFLVRMEVGDLVATPHGDDVHVGLVTSDPWHVPGDEEAHRRAVHWIHPAEPLDRSELSDRARSKLRTMLTVADLSPVGEEIARRAGIL